MDPAIRLLFREKIPVDEFALRTVRARIGSFAPLLAGATENTTLAANELAAAFLRNGGAESFELRIYAGDDRVRVELLDSMLSEANLTDPQDEEGQLRLQLLDAVTDRWGVLGDGISVVWFEVRRDEPAAGEDLRREM